MNDGNMIQEPPACPVCGLAVEERDPRRGKPLSIHRACRNRRREELRKERERGRRMSQESLLMASRNDVAEAAAELRRRVAWRNEAVGPADHGTVELCYWSVRCMAALMRLEPETLMAYEDRWAVDLARSIGRKGMDRIAGLTGWRGPRPWTMDPAMTDTGEDHTLEGMWPEPGPGVDDEWRADLDHDDGAGPRAVGMDRIIEGIWAEDHRGHMGRGPSRTQRRGPRMVVPRRRGQAMSDRPGTTGATSEWPRPGRCKWARCPHPETLVWADGYCSARCRRQARKAEPGRVPAGHCRMCGEPVYKPAQGPVPDFCSDRCRNRWNRLTRTGTSARPRRSCHECGARLDTGTRGEYCGDACRKAHDYKTARDRRTLRSAANAGTIERLRMNADDLLTRAHAIELDTETIRRHGIETRARTHILLMRMLTLAATHDPRSLTQAGPDGQIGRIIDACDRTGEDGDAERLLRRHGPARGAAGKGEEHAWPSA